MQNAIVRLHQTLAALLLCALLNACAARQPAIVATATTLPATATAVVATPSAKQVVIQATATPTLTPTPAPAAFFDDVRLTYEPDFYVPQLQAWLDTQPGVLKGLQTSVGGRRHTFAETLIGQTSYYSANPKVVLALLEMQSGLVSTLEPSTDQLAYAMGLQEKDGWRRGVQAQVRWAVRQMVYARRDYPQRVPFTFADKSTAPPPDGMTLSEYVVANVLAPTTTADQLRGRLDRFLETYTRLFGDPRPRLENLPPPAEPFLYWPLERAAPVTSFFDHGGPFLTRVREAAVTTYWGRDETDPAFAYDGHDGWDYAAGPPQLALAAAAGEVVFAGNADDNCSTRAVVIDHGNGYRTMYWHLARVDVEIGRQVGRGDSVGVVGESGCATGSHLHFGVQYLGRNTDPYGWCGANPDPWATHPAGTESHWLWADRISPCAPPPADLTLVDNTSASFSTTGEGWKTVIPGYGGDALAVASYERPPPPTPTFDPSASPTPTSPPTVTPKKKVTPEPTAVPTTPTPTPVPATARWTARVPKDGVYRVLAYVPYALSGLNDAREVRYRILSAEGEDEVTVSQSVSANEWAYLGTYTFRADQDAVVSLENFAELGGSSVWADAVVWQPVEP